MHWILWSRSFAQESCIHTCTTQVIAPALSFDTEREKFIRRQPPIGEKNYYDGEYFSISEGLPSSSRRRRREEGRGEGGRGREKVSTSEVDVGVDGVKSKIKVKRRRGHGWSAEDLSESVIEIQVVYQNVDKISELETSL